MADRAGPERTPRRNLPLHVFFSQYPSFRRSSGIVHSGNSVSDDARSFSVAATRLGNPGTRVREAGTGRRILLRAIHLLSCLRLGYLLARPDSSWAQCSSDFPRVRQDLAAYAERTIALGWGR